MALRSGARNLQIVPKRGSADAESLSHALAGAKGRPTERTGDGGEAVASPVSWTHVGAAWPDDLDEVPAWVHAAESRRAALGIMPAAVPYRTRRAFEAAANVAALAVAAASAQDTAAATVETVKVETVKVAPQDAASRFVAHVRGAAVIEMSNDALCRAYREFCAEARIECPENFFRAALKKTPGAQRIETVAYRPRRVREVSWVIAPAAAMVSDGNRRVSRSAVA